MISIDDCSSRVLSAAIISVLYVTLKLPVLLYNAKVWTLSDAVAMEVFERKILQKMFSLVRVGDYSYVDKQRPV